MKLPRGYLFPHRPTLQTTLVQNVPARQNTRRFRRVGFATDDAVAVMRQFRGSRVPKRRLHRLADATEIKEVFDGVADDLNRREIRH